MKISILFKFELNILIISLCFIKKKVINIGSKNIKELLNITCNGNESPVNNIIMKMNKYFFCFII